MSEESRLTAHAANTTVTVDGLRRVISQLRGKPVFEALLTTFLDETQTLEDAVWSLYALAIDNSSDDALDQLGDLLVTPRPTSMTDAVYRRVLHACVASLRSSGEGNKLSRVMRALVGSTAFTMTEVFPAAIVLAPDEATGIPVAVMRMILARAKAAGVGLAVVDVPAGDAFTFAASRMRVDRSDPDRGFSDATQATGGALVGVM